MKPIDAYPLTWPVGWRRMPAAQRTRAKFNKGKPGWLRDAAGQATVWQSAKELTVADGVSRVLNELRAMRVDADDVVISTNVELRLDGLPKSNRGAPTDPAAAVYWREPGRREPRCMAIDRYDRVQDNLAAIAATLEAMRAIERHGGAEILDRAFTGFTALPAPEQPWDVLGVRMGAPREEIEIAYRRLASQFHPDRVDGDADKMSRVNAARDAMVGRLLG